MTLLALVMALVMFGSVLFLFGGLVRLAVLALLGRWARLRSTATVLGVYLACYAAVLAIVALTTPRRVLAAGERNCFDDWCVAGVSVEPAAAGDAAGAVPAGERLWVATLEGSSDAKRVRQRALDAHALLEDATGRRRAPCAAPLGAHALADQLGPGESFMVEEPFLLPAERRPAGLVVLHGALLGAVIIGDDQSLLHAPTLLGAQVAR